MSSLNQSGSGDSLHELLEQKKVKEQKQKKFKGFMIAALFFSHLAVFILAQSNEEVLDIGPKIPSGHLLIQLGLQNLAVGPKGQDIVPIVVMTDKGGALPYKAWLVKRIKESSWHESEGLETYLVAFPKEAASELVALGPRPKAYPYDEKLLKRNHKKTRRSYEIRF